uniref:TIMELESS-interacting protein n=1 Tax=Romanomermis culicivorax TaxID=13658 RepID=A0A915J043_ROMCU
MIEAKNAKQADHQVTELSGILFIYIDNQNRIFATISDDWTFENHFASPGDSSKNDPSSEAQEDLKSITLIFVSDRERLCGPKGLEQIPLMFKNFKSKGKGDEFEDLTIIMTKLEHWAHRLYPKFTFDDFLWKMENLGSKKSVQVALHLIREKHTRPRSTDVNVDRKIDDQESSVAQASPRKNDNSPVLENTPILDDFDDIDFDNMDIKQVKNSQLTNDQKKRMEENRLRAMEIMRRKLESQITDMQSQLSETTATPENCDDSNFTDHFVIGDKSEICSAEDSVNSENLPKNEEMMSDDEILRFICH